MASRLYFERYAVTAHNAQQYLLRVSIGIDALLNAVSNYGTLGVTISSRAGTAAAHGHAWGIILWWLLDRCWPFGRDPVTGRSHCAGAIVNDKLRAQAVIDELNDPVVLAYLASDQCGVFHLNQLWPNRPTTWRETWHWILASPTVPPSNAGASTSTSKTASTSTSTATK